MFPEAEDPAGSTALPNDDSDLDLIIMLDPEIVA
jgi:hypothetical protein